MSWLLKHFKEKSIRLLGLIGFVTGLGLILISIFVHSAVLISLAIVFIILGDGLDPTYNGQLSQSTDESKQGKLQGVNQSLQSWVIHTCCPAWNLCEA